VRTTLGVRGNRITGTGTFDVLDVDGPFLFNAFTGFVVEGDRMKMIREWTLGRSGSGLEPG
jgi:hypothetical protein